MKTVNTGYRETTPGACFNCGFDSDWDVDGRGTVYCSCQCCAECHVFDGHAPECSELAAAELAQELKDADLKTYAESHSYRARYDSAEDDRSNWILSPCTRTRDSGLREISNWEVSIADLEALETAGQLEYAIHRFGHWGPGWYEIVIVKPTPVGVVWCVETAGALENYPLLSDDDHSTREHEAIWDYWAADGFREWMKAQDCPEDVAEVLEASEEAQDLCLRFCQRSEYGYESNGQLYLPSEDMNRDGFALLARAVRSGALAGCDPYVVIPLLHTL